MHSTEPILSSLESSIHSLPFIIMCGPALTRLVDRLEAATSRLEDMAQPISHPAGALNGTGLSSKGTPSGMGATAGAVAATSPQTPTELLPASIEGFDELINGPVSKFVNLSEELGGAVAEQVGASAASDAVADAPLSGQ